MSQAIPGATPKGLRAAPDLRRGDDRRLYDLKRYQEHRSEEAVPFGKYLGMTLYS